MRGLIILIAVLLSQCARPAPDIAYRLTPIIEPGSAPRLAVEIRFHGDADGETRLHLMPWGREEHPWGAVRNVRIEGASADAGTGVVRVLRHRPSAPLVVRYDVISASPDEPTGENLLTVHRPVVRRGWFLAYGEAAFAFPEGREEAPAGFSWGPAPSGWKLASNLDHRGVTSFHQVHQSILVGAPDLRLVQRTLPQGRLTLAIHGAWTFSDEKVADMTARIVAAERGFWHETGGDFLVPVLAIPAPKDMTNVLGTGRTEAFVIVATPNASLAKLTRILAHENMHTWIPSGLGPDRGEADEWLDKWFSEGFTDFYASRVLLRSGVYSLEEFARDTNEALARYAASPVRTATNAAILQGYQSNSDLLQLPYDRGQTFAALLDYNLRRKSDGRLGLDDVMLAQRKVALRDKSALVHETSDTLFPKVFARTGGMDIGPLIDRYIQRGEFIRLPADLYGDCGRVETLTMASFDIGFDGDATWGAGGVLHGVDPAGPAYAAGLRNGMRLLNHKSGADDAAVVVAYRVEDKGKENLVRYLPRGRGRFEGQRIVLTPGLTPAARMRCARTMSGG